MSFTLTATMKSHVDGEILSNLEFDVIPNPSTTVDASGNVVRVGGKRVRTDSAGQFSVVLATGDNLYYTVRRAYGPIPFNDITFKSPTSDGGTLDLADVAPTLAPSPMAPYVQGRGIESISDNDGDGTALVTYTDGTTSTLPLPPGPKGDPGTGGGGGTDLTSYAQVSSLSDYPETFPPDMSGFATVATTGSYNDLTDKPAVAGGPEWGAITGALTDQTDLANALAGKQPSGSYATAAQGALADTAVQPEDLGVKIEGILDPGETPPYTGIWLRRDAVIEPFTAAGTYTSTADVTSGAITLTEPAEAGSVLVVSVHGGGNTSTLGVSDSGGNTWTAGSATPTTGSAPHMIVQIFSAKITTALAVGDQITVTRSVSGGMVAHAAVLRGFNGIHAAQGPGSEGTADPITFPSITPTVGNILIRALTTQENASVTTVGNGVNLGTSATSTGGGNPRTGVLTYVVVESAGAVTGEVNMSTTTRFTTATVEIS